MIFYMPSLYPDELVYSWFCRFYVHSGYFFHSDALKELVNKRSNNASKEFLGHLNVNAFEQIKALYPIEELTLNHTMFPQYARFIPYNLKRKALDCLTVSNIQNQASCLPIPNRRKEDTYLRFCPECVLEDRKSYGETYWHRCHQIRGMTICPKHSCMLINSSVPTTSYNSFILYPAESSVSPKDVQFVDNLSQIEFAKYLAEVFSSPLDFDNCIPIHIVLFNAMKGTSYIRNSSGAKNTRKLVDDLRMFYKDLCFPNYINLYQAERLLTGDKTSFTEICQIAYYLNLSVSELLRPQISNDIMALEQKSHYVANVKKVCLPDLDRELESQVSFFVRQIYDGSKNKNGIPDRVTVKRVSNLIGVSERRLSSLPKCKAIINKYSESYEEFWARRLVWAYEVLEPNEAIINWTDLRNVSFVKIDRAVKALPFLTKYTDTKTAQTIKSLVLKVAASE